MSINIPAETPDESTNPISVEEFERLHPAMLGAIRKAVREEPARTVIGTVGDDRRSHLSSLDLRGIGIEVGRQLSARDMTTEVMGSILERINQAADRCGIKEGTLAYWRGAGIGPKFVKVGRTVMYPKEPMIAYFKEHLYQSTCEYEGKESA